MKIRNGFVSNSSSSSFIIKKQDVTELQIIMIKDYIRFSSIWENKGIYFSDDYSWNIYEEDDCINGNTSMNNFDMHHYLELIGVNMDKVEWY